ncbi:MAG: ATP-binding protein, partial [Bacteroidales bacterium]
MIFVDRTDEMARFRAALTQEKPSLVALYGRRRLGKSTLIKKVLSEQDVYFLADRSEAQHQRILLAKVLGQQLPDFLKFEYTHWEAQL